MCLSMWCFKGNTYVGKPADYGRDKAKEFFAKDYHQVSDTVRPDWEIQRRRRRHARLL